jgi:hypothetical protein
MMTRYRWWIINLSWIGLSLAVIVPVAPAASPPAGDTGRPILRTHPRGPATPVMVSLGLYVAGYLEYR